ENSLIITEDHIEVYRHHDDCHTSRKDRVDAIDTEDGITHGGMPSPLFTLTSRAIAQNLKQRIGYIDE
ncbi:MAG TPA: hypothetical protein DHW79_11660, partial [Candidatus Cloacimonas sp.]|nr:hypothetical protein [Candidatus Cloacimonas sp.]